MAMRRETLKLHTAAQGEHLINVEITETDEERAQGLMFRTHMPENSGMLFFYKTPREITMWMRNTYIPLDMVFIRKDGRCTASRPAPSRCRETIISSRGAPWPVLSLPVARPAVGPQARRQGRSSGLQAAEEIGLEGANLACA